MTSFRKMQLVTDEEINRLRQKQIAQYDPELRAAAFLQSEMDQLLTDKGMDSDQRLRLLQMAQQRFAAIRGKQQLEKPTLGGISSKMSEDQPEDVAQAQAAPPIPAQVAAPAGRRLAQRAPDLPMEQRYLLDLLPKNAKEKAKMLMYHLRRVNANFDVDAQGQLVVQGQPLVGSNFQDLLLSLYTRRKDHNPPRLQDFIAALKNVNVPRSLISNVHLLTPKSISSLTSSSLFTTSHLPSTSSSKRPKQEGPLSQDSPSALSPSESDVFHDTQSSLSFNPFSTMHLPPGQKPKVLKVYKTSA